MLNKVILVGNLGADPEIHYTQAGNPVAGISLATSERWKDKDGNKQARTEWHRVTCYNKLAEIAGEYLKKGRQVYIEGSLRTEKYSDKEGVERTVTKIVARELLLLGGKLQESNPDSEPTDANGTSDSAPAESDDIPF